MLSKVLCSLAETESMHINHSNDIDDYIFILGSTFTWTFLQIFPIGFFNVFLILINYHLDSMLDPTNKCNL